MSVRLMSKAFMTPLPASQKLVLIVMCDYANDDGLSCHPSVAQVAVKSSLSDRQCKRVLKQLQDDGYLSVIGNPNGGKPGTTRHYRISIERLSTGDADDTRTSVTHDTPTGDTGDTGDKLTRVTPEAKTGDTGDMGGVTPRAETGDTHDTQPTIDPSVEPSENRQKEMVRQVFDHWVTVMGKQSNRTKLTDERRKKIIARLNDYPVEDLITAIDGCASSSFHMGDNPEGAMHNSLELIFRNGDKLEAFRDRAEKKPKGGFKPAPPNPYGDF